MNTEHIVSGIYTSHAAAEKICDQLVGRGLQKKQIHIVESNASVDTINRKMVTDDNTLRNVLVDGVVGASVGTGLGVIAELALVAANVTLFVASPLIAPLAMLGWGAALGGVAGAAIGSNSVAKNKEGRFSDLVMDAIRSGHVVLVVHTSTEAETTLVRTCVGDSLLEKAEQPTMTMLS